MRDALNSIPIWFRRLSQREQLSVLGIAAGVLLLALLITAFSVSTAIGRSQQRVTVKSDQLRQVLSLQGQYRAQEQERAARMASLGRSQIRLVSVVEDAARRAGVEIGQLRPEEGEPNAQGVIESRVILKASKVSIDRLQAFLTGLKTSQGLVIVQRLKINRPYRQDTLEAEVTVLTYKLKSS